MCVTIYRFLIDEEGGTTVSWIVLSASAVSVALATLVLISERVDRNGTDLTVMLETYTIDNDFDDAAYLSELEAAVTEAAEQ